MICNVKIVEHCNSDFKGIHYLKADTKPCSSIRKLPKSAMAWILRKSHLQAKPVLSQGLAHPNEDRQLELGYQNLRQLEDVSKKVYKEVRRYGDSVALLHRLEQTLASDLSNSPVCHSDETLRQIAEEYSSVVYQLGHATNDLTQLTTKTVVDPMKKLNAEFAFIAAALKRRDEALNECLKLQSKFEKLNKLEKTGANVAKTSEAKGAFVASKDRFDKANKLLLLELPQFYEKRVDYFQPCLQALIRAQVEYFGETTRLFTHLVATKSPESGMISLRSDKDHQDDVDKKFAELKSLSIVG